MAELCTVSDFGFSSSDLLCDLGKGHRLFEPQFLHLSDMDSNALHAALRDQGCMRENER